MASEDLPRVADPRDVQDLDLSVGLSSLTVEADDSHESPSLPQTRKAKLGLLQPLATSAMLAACRDPSSRTVRFPDGRPSDSLGPEFLDISSLSKAWRKALVEVPPVTHLTFDLTLPKAEVEGNPESVGENESGDVSRRVYWDTAAPARGHHLAVRAPDVMRLAVTIATTVRMRTEGDVRFDVAYDEDDDASPRAMKLLKQQLLAIASTGVSAAAEKPVSQDVGGVPNSEHASLPEVGSQQAI
ncbi:hypothetical protein AURDEDRAFT_182467 [Auricularia subglabra TFB-10046 SS5]|nr:hypothetical protein AURDEDRAFT_182467 [Auricularia subglabra TFB-10046 SS5]